MNHLTNEPLTMNYEPQTTSDKRPATRSARTIAQKNLIMQNKPNFPNAQMNVSSVLTKDYENIPFRRCAENKPNQTQFKANSKPIQTQSNPILTQMHRKQTQSNPISNPISNHPREFMTALIPTMNILTIISESHFPLIRSVMALRGGSVCRNRLSYQSCRRFRGMV